ncbi:hypothetical protein IM816_11680 [Luteibacter flocculans]|uniref:Uncharacterized protein n=1 Tax=Luteibacter flocculans TaxID=2780091 RepID=A0ABY4T0D5_9GAMM|nr:hypothetical protein [Luteibacter flocculans]URL57298.1 hypothetical protein IM816_11680 [Luteibacter flocculans]
MDTMIARAFRIVSMATAVAFFAACAGQEPRHSGGVTASPSGGEVVTNMLARFNNLDIQCGGGTNPRLTCNGVYMRATKRGEGFHVWNPNPDSPNKNSVSFSWLNKRGSFGGLAFDSDNGFTLLPSDQAWQAGLDPVSALCLFPYDAATWNRSDDGCGAYPGIPGSGPCQAQNITNADEWIARYGAGGMYGSQCSFDAHLVWPVYQGWEVRSKLKRPDLHKLHNEVMLRAWRKDDPGLPLESFFYIGGSAKGRGEAMANQRDFKAVIGRWVPVVQIVLPQSEGNDAYFRYLPEDQAVPATRTASIPSAKH